MAVRIKIHHIDYIGTWSLPANADTCGICHSVTQSKCVRCLNSDDMLAACPVQIGECGHGFHEHCIDRWLRQQRICPMCSKPWNKKKVSNV